MEHKYGFTKTLIRNPSLDKIHQTIQQYLNKRFADDEQLFIYFSGHGEFVPYPNTPKEGKGYFIPSDAKRNAPSSVERGKDLQKRYIPGEIHVSLSIFR
ncbi:MAG: caspase family protein [Phaeodactylibacter sp.]|nr:caspase family protein [Phaeodactylibacter sp.]